MKLNDPADLHAVLVAKTLQGALRAQQESDQVELERCRRDVIRTLNHWADHNRETVLQALPALRGLCACDCVMELEEGAFTAEYSVLTALSAWEYAERHLAAFVLITAENPIPGVRLALMYQLVSKSSWPRVA